MKVFSIILNTMVLPQRLLQTTLTRPLTYAYLTKRCYKSRARKSSSAIFISNRDSDVSANFQFDENLNQRLADLPRLKKDLEHRGVKLDVDQLAADYENYQQMDAKRSDLEARRASVSKTIAQVVKVEQEQIVSKDSKDMIQELRAEGKQLKKELKTFLPQFWSLQETVMLRALSLPNETSPDVTEEEHVLEEHYQDERISVPEGHLETVMNHGGVKLSNVGNKSFYLRGRLAVLEQKLIHRFTAHLRCHGYVQMCAPEMFKTAVVEAGGLSVTDREAVYRLQCKQTGIQSDWDQDLTFIQGASSLSFLAYLARMEISSKDLPLKMFVVGRNYMPDNKCTKSLPGLLGALQSTKVCLSVVTKTRDECEQMFEKLPPLMTEIYSKFNLPFRLVQCPVSQLMPAEQKRLEVQMWVPSLQYNLTVASMSVCGDYSSRRLMIRAADDSQSDSSTPVYMIHSEVADITRLIAILLENKQTDIRTY